MASSENPALYQDQALMLSGENYSESIVKDPFPVILSEGLRNYMSIDTSSEHQRLLYVQDGNPKYRVDVVALMEKAG